MLIGRIRLSAHPLTSSVGVPPFVSTDPKSTSTMSRSETLDVGEPDLRCDTWHSGERTVVLRLASPTTPVGPTMSVAPDSIRRALTVLGEHGVRLVLTAALDTDRLEPFVLAGFAPFEELCVLRHDLEPEAVGEAEPRRVVPRIRRGSGRWDLRGAGSVDQAAFSNGAALDHVGLRRILAATPDVRFRVVVPDDDRHGVGAYAIAGAAGVRGYIQRLAVDPECRHRGYAGALVADALDWLRRRGVATVVVNTNVDNIAGRQLYHAGGFVDTDQRLEVLSWQPERHR